MKTVIDRCCQKFEAAGEVPIPFNFQPKRPPSKQGWPGRYRYHLFRQISQKRYRYHLFPPNRPKTIPIPFIFHQIHQKRYRYHLFSRNPPKAIPIPFISQSFTVPIPFTDTIYFHQIHLKRYRYHLIFKNLRDRYH